MKLHVNMELDTVVTQSKDIATSDMDGEKVMMNVDKGKYYALNSIGSYIWEMIDRPQTINEIIVGLRKDYDVDADTCSENVLAFVKRLYDEGLVSIG